MRRILSLLLLTFAALSPAAAQNGGFRPYAWETGDLALIYPAGWDAPVPLDAGGSPTLELAQTLAASPETRPPGIPIIRLAVFPPDAAEDATLLLNALQTLGIAASQPSPGVLLGFDGLAAEGVSADELLFGLGRAARLADGRALVVAGRAPAAQREPFTRLFNTVADSLALGAASTPIRPVYGVLWHRQQTLADGESALVAPAALAVGPDDRLYVVDEFLGVVALDAATGTVLGSDAFDALSAPADLTIDALSGAVYVADPLCPCVQPVVGGVWGAPYDGFASGAPRSLAPAADGFYATDLTDTEAGVRYFRFQQADAPAFIPLGEGITDQPLLTTDAAGRLLALAVDGRLLALDGERFTPLHDLNTTGLVVNDFAALPDGSFLLATDNQGLLIVDASGQVLDTPGRIVANSPLPGEFVRPRAVAVGRDGTLYVADGDSTFGAITAMNTAVEAGRVGSSTLSPGVVVQGALNSQSPAQDWTLLVSPGQWLMLSAADSGGGALDVALRLISPDGRELAYNDDQPGTDLPNITDAQIPDYRAAEGGRYTVRVERVNGSGGYSLGVAREQPLALSAEGVTELSGTIQAALPAERWMFQAAQGQTLTITMQARSGTLDALLRLFDAEGNLIAENDDADDPALGKDAQIVGVRLEADRVYTLEARRFSGEGAYTLLLVAISD